MWFPRLDSDLNAAIARAKYIMDEAIDKAESEEQWQHAHKVRTEYVALTDERDRRLLVATSGDMERRAVSNMGHVVHGGQEDGDTGHITGHLDPD